MPALEPGAPAPNISLPTLSGSPFSLAQALRSGPAVLLFFKVSCPTCQYAFPLFERLYQAHRGSNATIIGISQNDSRDTEAFVKQYGITFPVALDDSSRYPASNAYGLTNVPTVFLVSSQSKIELSSVGWSKSDIEDLHRRLVESGGRAHTAPQLFDPGVSDFKAG